MCCACAWWITSNDLRCCSMEFTIRNCNIYLNYKVQSNSHQNSFKLKFKVGQVLNCNSHVTCRVIYILGAKSFSKKILLKVKVKTYESHLFI